ncbi:MAG: hypothetical protein U0797_30320 [Gemmataceae bacterium]
MAECIEATRREVENAQQSEGPTVEFTLQQDGDRLIVVATGAGDIVRRWVEARRADHREFALAYDAHMAAWRESGAEVVQHTRRARQHAELSRQADAARAAVEEAREATRRAVLGGATDLEECEARERAAAEDLDAAARASWWPRRRLADDAKAVRKAEALTSFRFRREWALRPRPGADELGGQLADWLGRAIRLLHPHAPREVTRGNPQPR